MTRVSTIHCARLDHVEDDESMQEDNEWRWLDCYTPSHKQYHLIDHPTGQVNLDSFGPDDSVVLKVQELDAPPEHPLHGSGAKLHAVLQVVTSQDLSQRVSKIRANHTAGEAKVMTQLFMILEYNDYKPTYTSEEHIVNQMFGAEDGTEGTFAHLISTATYGRIVAPRANHKIVRVPMESNWADISGCPYDSFTTTSAAQMAKHHPNINMNEYQFHQIIIPSSPSGGCGWGGLANLGCGHYDKIGNYRLPCTAWYRVPQIFAWTHELGHNLGLSHAGGDNGGSTFVEYGDRQASMGASYRMSSFTASARHQMGVLHDTPGEAAEWDPSKGKVRLQSLSLPLPSPESGAYVGVRFNCPNCVSKVRNKPQGGNVWVQFRGDEGYSKYRLSEEWQNKVYVHLHRAYTSKYWGRGSELWARLGAREGWSAPEADYAVHVCSIDGDVATVAFGSTEAEAASSCSTDSGTPATTQAPAPATEAPTTAAPTTAAPTTAAPTTAAPTTAAPTTTTTSAAPGGGDGSGSACTDIYDADVCFSYKEGGFCESNVAISHEYCRVTCNTCSDGACVNKFEDETCQTYAEAGYCCSNVAVQESCEHACGCGQLNCATTTTTTTQASGGCMDNWSFCDWYLDYCGSNLAVDTNCPLLCGICAPEES
jgi:hypothetical protein